MNAEVKPVFAWIAIGSNQGDRLQHLIEARFFLQSLSENAILASSIYETEPIGPADKPFLNAVVRISTFETPEKLLEKLKAFEVQEGRDLYAPRWSNRCIDLDIIEMQQVHINLPWLQIPHKEYAQRLFVLVPLHQIEPELVHSVNGKKLSTLIKEAPFYRVQPSALKW